MSKTIADATWVQLDFSLMGLSKKEKTLASGLERNQLGVFLAGKNQCNLLYAMLRIRNGRATPVIQIKSNSNKVTHQECGNAGYKTLSSTLVPSKELKLEAKQIYRLTANIVASKQLEVKLNDVLIWQGLIDPDKLNLQNGLVGVRSDNVDYRFDLSSK